MKIFVTWSPHDISPLLEEYVDGFSVSLAWLSRCKLERGTVIGIRRLLGVSKEVMLDSLGATIAKARASPYDPRSQRHILNLQLWLRPDYIVHKDYPLLSRDLSAREKEKLLEKTIRNAEIMTRLRDEFGLKNVIYVIQGWNLESMVYCAKRYVDLGVDMYGLGSSINVSPGELVRRLRAVREVIGERAYLHVFGALKPSHFHAIREYVDSVDTSTPIKSAAMGYVLFLDRGHVRRIRFYKASLEDLDLPPSLYKEVEEVISELGERYEDRPPITRLKRVLAAVNAYILRRALLSSR